MALFNERQRSRSSRFNNNTFDPGHTYLETTMEFLKLILSHP